MDKPRITADYETGNIDESLLVGPDDGMINENPRPPMVKKPTSLGLPVGVPSVEKIRGSKLPDAIKTAMIKTPIPVPDISLSDGLDIDITNKARQLMERDGTIPVKRPQKQNLQEAQRVQQLPDDFESRLVPIIEAAIRKVFNEKLIQILDAQNSVTINENLVIKVGDSLFSGKITKVKNTK
jgi:hypothetical protein